MILSPRLAAMEQSNGSLTTARAGMHADDDCCVPTALPATLRANAYMSSMVGSQTLQQS